MMQIRRACSSVTDDEYAAKQRDGGRFSAKLTDDKYGIK
jgi:hypothetical protein